MFRFFLLTLFLFGFVYSQNFNYEEGDWWILIHPGTINAITETYDDVYFAADNGIFRADKRTHSIQFDNIFSEDLLNDSIKRLFYDYNTDIFWALTDRGLYLRASSDSFWRKSIFEPVDWDVNAIGSSDDFIWIDYENNLVALDAVSGAKITPADQTFPSNIRWDSSRFSRNNDASDFYNFVLEDDDEPTEGTRRNLLNYSIHPTVKFTDNNENIYFGTAAGEIYFAYEGSHRMTQITAGLAQQNVTEIYKDMASNWWFADSPFKREGTQLLVNPVFLTRWSERDDSWTYYYFNEDADIINTNINCMLRYRDTLYLGTMSGLLILDINRREWTILKDDLNDPAIWALAVSGDNLYAATVMGINEISLLFPTVIPDTENIFTKFLNHQVYDLKSFNNFLYVGADNGLYRFDPIGRKWLKLSDRKMRSMTVNDSLTFASDGFLWSIEPDSSKSVVYSDDEVFNYTNYGPWLWINEGEQVVLAKYDKAFQRVYNKFDGIPGSKIFEIGCDDHWVWFGTDNGVAFYNWSRYYQVDK